MQERLNEYQLWIFWTNCRAGEKMALSLHQIPLDIAEQRGLQKAFQPDLPKATTHGRIHQNVTDLRTDVILALWESLWDHKVFTLIGSASAIDEEVSKDKSILSDLHIKEWWSKVKARGMATNGHIHGLEKIWLREDAAE